MKWYVVVGAIAGAIYAVIMIWPASSGSEIVWWYFGGYILGSAAGGAMGGAGLWVLKSSIERNQVGPKP